MTRKKNLRNLLIIGLVLCSLGGLTIHFIVNDSGRLQFFYVPLISGLISIFIIPLLFMTRKTVHYGYVINGMTVIIGTVTMIHSSIAHFPVPFEVSNLIFKTLFADICILAVKFFIGKALFDLEMFGADPKSEYKVKWYRYPNTGWWGVHLVTISIVYTIGHLLWRSL